MKAITFLTKNDNDYIKCIVVLNYNVNKFYFNSNL